MSISEQAAEWYVELDEPAHSAELRRRFFGWLKQSPQHIEEFLAVSQLEKAISKPSASITEILREVKTCVRRPAVPLFTDAAADHRIAQPVPRNRWRRAAWAAAAGIAALAVILLTRLPLSDAPATVHRTALGEQRSIALGDGSIVTLNTLSEVVVRFDDDARRVSLLKGEAMFDVTHDATRPFVVNAGPASVDVVGTKFSIYRKGDSTQVAVIEGTVSARSSGEPGSHIELHGGEGAVFSGSGEISREVTFDVERAVAWTERRLVFDNARLADVASEFNRYNRLQLRIDDSGLAERQITTVINAHDVRALVGFLKLQPDVEIDYGKDIIRIRTEAP